MSGPTVSVIVPTYNRAALLPRALDSIVAQRFGDWEIILVDDGSTDDTQDVARRYARDLGDRFGYVRQDNAGAGAARNRGIDACRGRFVAFLDSDDEFLPNKFSRQLTLFSRRPELGFVYSDYAYIGLDGVRHESVFDTIGRFARRVPCASIAPNLAVCRGSLFDHLIREYFIATIVGLVRREVLGDHIRFPTHLHYAEEWLFFLQVSRACRAGFVDEPLCLHHHVAGSVSRSDVHRNTEQLRNLLLAMPARLGPLSRAHRRAIRHNLGRAYRQLGCNWHRIGDHRRAARSFAHALAATPSPRNLLDVIRCGARSIISAGPRATSESVIATEA